MGMLFDLDFVIAHFDTCNLGHYLEIIRRASKAELRQFRSQVKQHQKTHKSGLAYSNTPFLTTHGAIISAINHELLKRSLWFKVWFLVIPIRQLYASKFRGLELQRHENFGVIYTKPQHQKSILHTSFPEMISAVWKFIVRNETVIVTGAIGIVSAIVGALFIKWVS